MRTGWIAASLALALGAAHADIVTDWNERAAAVLDAEKVTAGYSSARTMAIVHAAMFDALTAVDLGHAPYVSTPIDVAGASAPDALHAAARRALVELYPRQKAMIDAAYAAAVGSAGASASVVVGDKAALAVLETRKNDGSNGPNLHRPVTAPGVWVVTAQPILPWAATVKPFALRTLAQFRPGPPPALNSAVYTRDYIETKALGSATSVQRTAWQAETARFWVISGITAWNQAARGLVAAKPLPLVDSARLFAQLNMALHDAILAVYEAKYEYGFWRPVTAIRNGDRDGNDATERDAGWTPLIETPLHPEYPCAHCVLDGAGGAVLKKAIGSGPTAEFTLTYAAMPGVTRTYTSIQQLEDEVAMARIWGGVHYRNSNEVGNALGASVGTYVMQSTLQPRR